MKTQYFSDVDETVITTTLSNGLRLQVVPSPGVSQKLCDHDNRLWFD